MVGYRVEVCLIQHKTCSRGGLKNLLGIVPAIKPCQNRTKCLRYQYLPARERQVVTEMKVPPAVLLQPLYLDLPEVWTLVWIHLTGDCTAA